MALADNSPTLTLTSPSPYFRCIPQFVTEDRELYFVARHLFTVIAQAVNLNTNRVQMTIEELAERAGISVRSVIRYTSELEKKGHIRVERAARGSKIPNVYHLAGAAGCIVLRRSPEEAEQEQAATGQPTSPAVAEQVPASQSSPAPAPTGAAASVETPAPVQVPDRQLTPLDLYADDDILPLNKLLAQWDAAEERQKGIRTTATVAVEEAGRVPQRPTTKEGVNVIDEKAIEEEPSVVAADSLSPIFKLDGLPPERMQALTDQYGPERMWVVLNALDKRRKHIENPVGWVLAALQRNFELGRENKKQTEPQDGSKYITGKYAAFINH